MGEACRSRLRSPWRGSLEEVLGQRISRRDFRCSFRRTLPRLFANLLVFKCYGSLLRVSRLSLSLETHKAENFSTRRALKLCALCARIWKTTLRNKSKATTGTSQYLSQVHIENMFSSRCTDRLRERPGAIISPLVCMPSQHTAKWRAGEFEKLTVKQFPTRCVDIQKRAFDQRDALYSGQQRRISRWRSAFAGWRRRWRRLAILVSRLHFYG